MSLHPFPQHRHTFRKGNTSLWGHVRLAYRFNNRKMTTRQSMASHILILTCNISKPQNILIICIVAVGLICMALWLY